MNKFLFTVFFLLFLMGCSEKKEELKSPILTLKEMGKLATAEYIITKVVRASDNKTWYKIGDRKILISCKASVKAGIDLTKIAETAVDSDLKKISIQLPPPQVLSFNLSAQNIKVEYTDVGLLRSDFSNAEINGIMQQAEIQIKNQISAMGILQSARENAGTFIRNFFTNAGFEEVVISY